MKTMNNNTGRRNDSDIDMINIDDSEGLTRVSSERKKNGSGSSKSGSGSSRSGKSSSGTRRSGSGNRTSSSRSSASGNSSERKNSKYGTVDKRYSEEIVRNNSKKKKKKKKGKEYKREKARWKRFWICLAVYAGVLLILSIIFLAYTDNCLKKYEKSQSVYAMEEYFNSFSASVAAGQLPENMMFEGSVSEFDTVSTISSAYLSSIAGKTLTFEKAPDSYMTETPEYNILADGTPVARVKLEGVNGQVILGILTVMDWNIVEVKPVISMESHTYTITVPDGYIVNVNGTVLSDSYLSGETEEIDLFQYAKEYADLQGMRKYVINDVKSDLAITVTDAAGNPVSCNVSGYDYNAFYSGSGDMPEDLYSMALNMAETWSLLMTRDLSGSSNGFYTVAEYLINGSYYYNMAYEWATGVDITFTSAHTLKDPAFTDIVVDDYVRYSDNCFSCHIFFNKNLTLTRTGEDRVDTTDSTFIFVYYDDSDDGVDNPHWAIVDMIANTEGN